jgi:thioredoxin-dependent peroxiredoxin
MAQVTLRGNPISTNGELPAVGSAAPDFTLAGGDLGDLTKDSLAGQKVILNIFPSVDTPTCASSVRTFNERAAEREGTTVVCISEDLPFALNRFCGAEGLENVKVASAFRSDFTEAYGLTLQDGPLRGLAARAIVVLDENGNVSHTQLVGEIADEPDYDAALAALD